MSTQVPNSLEIVTNKESTRVQLTNVGPQRVKLRRARTTITKDNVNALQFLDLMNNITLGLLDETEWFMLSKFIKDLGITRDEILKHIGLFPAKAMKKMMEIEDIYKLK